MDRRDNPLRNYLMLYHFADTALGPGCTLSIQSYLAYRYSPDFQILQEKRLQKIQAFSFSEKDATLSLTVEDGDILFIRAVENEMVTAGGIWQVQWRNDEDYGGSNGYVFVEICSSGIEMVKVETVLQEEEYALFEDAVTQANRFLQEQGTLSSINFVDAREVGPFAPERIHQGAFPSCDIRTVEHTWLLLFSGFKEACPETLFFLIEVVSRFQNLEGQFSVRVLEEGNDPSLLGSY